MGGRIAVVLVTALSLGWAADAQARPAPAARRETGQPAKPETPAARDAYYLVEILFRDGDGALLLGRDLLTPTHRAAREIPVIGFAPDGELAKPPPGGEQPRTVRPADVKSPPWKQAARWASRDKADAPKLGTAAVGNDDIAVAVPLPAKESEHTLAFWCQAVYRIERLSGEQAKKFQPLKNDRAFWAKRTRELCQEILVNDRAWVLAEPSRLAQAAVLLRDPGLLDAVRQELRKPTFPSDALLDAIVQIGTGEDFALLKSLWKANPPLAGALPFRVALMARRIGPAAGRDLILELLNCDRPVVASGSPVDDLLAKDPKTPRPLVCDQMAFELARQFDLDPASIGMAPAAQRLLEVAGDKLPKKDTEYWEASLRNRTGDWVMAGPAARAEGIEKMKNWLELKSSGRLPDIKTQPDKPSPPPRPRM